MMNVKSEPHSVVVATTVVALLVASSTVVVADTAECPVSRVQPHTWEQRLKLGSTTERYTWYLDPCAKSFPRSQDTCDSKQPKTGFFGQWKYSEYYGSGSCEFLMNVQSSNWTYLNSSALGSTGYHADFMSTVSGSTASVDILCEPYYSSTSPYGDVIAKSNGTKKFHYTVTLVSAHVCPVTTAAPPPPTTAVPPTPAPTNAPIPPGYMDKDILGAASGVTAGTFVLFLMAAAAKLCCVDGGSGKGMCKFWTRRNLFHFFIGIVATICIFPTAVVVSWTLSDRGTQWVSSTSSSKSSLPLGDASSGSSSASGSLSSAGGSSSSSSNTVLNATESSSFAPSDSEGGQGQHEGMPRAETTGGQGSFGTTEVDKPAWGGSSSSYAAASSSSSSASSCYWWETCSSSYSSSSSSYWRQSSSSSSYWNRGGGGSAPPFGPTSPGWAAHLMLIPIILAGVHIWLTAIVAGVNIRTVAPWSSTKYKSSLKDERLIRLFTLWWTWISIAMGVSCHLVLRYLINHDDLSLPDDLKITIFSAMIADFAFDGLVLMWFCFLAWCSKAPDHVNYPCPVCYGDTECPACHGEGEAYLNP